MMNEIRRFTNIKLVMKLFSTNSNFKSFIDPSKKKNADTTSLKESSYPAPKSNIE